jgi:hypothetical protein
MTRGRRLEYILAGVGLVSLVAVLLASIIPDVELFHRLQANPHGSVTLFWILRLTIVPVITMLGAIAFVLAAKGRRVGRWYVVVAVLLVALIVTHGPRHTLTYLGFYLSLASYVVAALIAKRGA